MQCFLIASQAGYQSVFLLVGVLYVITAQLMASMCCAIAIHEPS
jgi:hypothetical protein